MCSLQIFSIIVKLHYFCIRENAIKNEIVGLKILSKVTYRVIPTKYIFMVILFWEKYNLVVDI